MVADRNQNGVAESWHSTAADGTSGYGPWMNYSYTIVAQGKFGFPVNLQTNWGSCGGVNCPTYSDPPAAMNGLMVDFSRADGYSYGPYAVQGVRSYDSTSQQWLTPDAFAGGVDSPMSQKPFIWSANNPVAWSDPSGYDPWPETQNFFDTEPVIPADATVVCGGQYGNVISYTVHPHQIPPTILTDIAETSVYDTMLFSHSAAGKGIDNSDFMKLLASSMNGYLEYGNYSTYTAGFTVSATETSVSGNNGVGNSVNISGLMAKVVISESLGSTNVTNATMTWSAGIVMIHQDLPGADTEVFSGNGIVRSHGPGVNLPPDVLKPNDVQPPPLRLY